jgi:transposase, IS5 family
MPILPPPPAAGKRAHAIASKLRSRAAAGREGAMAAVTKANAELADLAGIAAAEAGRVLANAKRALRKARTTAAQRKVDGRPDPVAGRRRGRLARAVNDLEELLEATRPIAAQTRQRLAGVTPDGSTRRASLHDPDARPIAKGRLGKPVEFGHKAQVVDNDDGVVLDHDVQPGNPTDAPRMEPAIKRVARRTGRNPLTVAADRGYGEASVDDALHNLGVRNVVIPRKGRPTKARQAEEHRRAFRRHLKWRTGCEGRISTLKRGYGWDRSRIDTTEGARIWVGHGVLTHNLVKISALAS